MKILERKERDAEKKKTGDQPKSAAQLMRAVPTLFADNENDSRIKKITRKRVNTQSTKQPEVPQLANNYYTLNQHDKLSQSI